MEIRQAWLEQGSGGWGTGGGVGCGLERGRGKRERVHWSEMGHQGKVREAD